MGRSRHRPHLTPASPECAGREQLVGNESQFQSHLLAWECVGRGVGPFHVLFLYLGKGGAEDKPEGSFKA